MTPPAELQAASVRYAGRVQGVGFRATSARIAGRYPVTGWVRNLPDGSVQLWIEGERPEIEACLSAIREYFSGHIRTEAIDWQPPTGAYYEFDIVY